MLRRICHALVILLCASLGGRAEVARAPLQIAPFHFDRDISSGNLRVRVAVTNRTSRHWHSQLVYLSLWDLQGETGYCIT